MVKSAYRSMGFTGMSQAGAIRELSFSISASQRQGAVTLEGAPTRRS